jgi:hypothetical protein
VVLVAGLASAGCEKPEAPPSTDDRADPVVVGLERLIPLEAVFVGNAGEATPADFNERMERATAITNQMFGATGIQFYLRSSTGVIAPDLAAWRYRDMNAVPPIPGDELIYWDLAGLGRIRDDLDALFGTTTFPYRGTGERLSRADWLTLGILQYGRPDAIHVVVGSAFNASEGQLGGRALFMAYADIAIGNALLGHELGHHLGLNHPWEAGFPNPRTQAPLGLAGYWDLVYCAGTSAANPAVAFTNQAAAEAGCPAGTGPMRLKMGVDLADAATTCNGNQLAMACTWAAGTGAVGGYTPGAVTHLDPRMLGSVSFQGSGGLGDRGANAMAYVTMGTATSFSPSQIQIMRDTLRYDRRLNLDTGALCPGSSYCALNTAALGKTGLGVATTTRPPLYKLDVNGDGLRDLVLWRVDSIGSFATNNAVFTVFYAPSFTCSESANFGRPDDTPAVMDFNGDGRFDQGLYRPDQSATGSRTAGSIWYWCPSVATPPAVSATCPSPPTTAGRLGSCAGGGWGAASFGEKRDVPLPGLKFGATPQLAVYRPDNSTFYWGAAANPYPFSQTTTYGVLPDKGPRDLILDDYDGDGLVDPGTYDRQFAFAAVSLSSGGWGAGGLRKFWFPLSYNGLGYDIPVPDPGTPILSSRAGGLPIVGARREIFGAAPLHLPKTVGTLTVWDPALGTACTVRDSTAAIDWGAHLTCDASGTSVGTTTALGSVGDIPLGGLKAAGVFDSVAGLAYIHFTAAGATSLERRIRSTSGTTSLPSRPLVGCNPRGGATFVADMGQDGTTGGGTGADGLPELLIQGTSAGTWHVYWSNTDYATRTTVTTGSMLSHML